MELSKNQKETWKPVVGYENLYLISNTGKLKTIKTNTLKCLQKDRKGYLYANIYKNNKSKCLKIHRAVAEAFISNPENKPQVNHLDCNVQNNNVSNLKWCTPKENSEYMVLMGNSTRGEKSKNSILKEKDILKIRNLKGKMTQIKIASIYNVNRGTINSKKKKKNWKHV